MARIPTLAALAIAAGLATSTATAQQPAAVAQPYVVNQPYTYAQPAVAAPARDSRAVLPAFSRRGGIGTTPFLGNTRGLGAFSTNYDAPPRPTTTLTYPARRRGLFGRMFNR